LGGHRSILSSNSKPKIPKVANYWNQKVVVACIVRFNNKNNYSWTKKIHTIKMIGIIICARRIIIGCLANPKTSSPLKCRRQFIKDDLDV
jgi:hypothetical protein